MRVAALALAFLAACSSNSASPAVEAGAGDEGAVVSCDDPKQQTYSAGMQQPGASGVFTFVLVSSDPAPPANDNNTWVLRLLDGSGQPVTGATFAALATMPTMTHGTTPVTITPNADGTYTFTPLYFFMAGLWQVAITAQSGAQKDTTSFYFCVAG